MVDSCTARQASVSAASTIWPVTGDRAPVQRGERALHGEHAGQAVAQRQGQPRGRPAGEAVHVPQSAGGFGHRGVTRLVRLGAGLSVTGHAHQDDAPIAFAQHVVTEIPLLQGAGPEVLDDDVGLLDEVEEELAALGLAQVQRHGLLVARVDRPEEVVSVEFGLTPGAQRIWGAWWLDLDDLGAHVAQQSPGERSGDQRADLDDPDAVERAGHGHLAPVTTRAGAASPCTTPTAWRNVSRWSGPA